MEGPFSTFINGMDDILTTHGRVAFFKIINIEDLDLMLRGSQELDFQEWKNSTTYDGYHMDDLQIHWFWEVSVTKYLSFITPFFYCEVSLKCITYVTKYEFDTVD